MKPEKRFCSGFTLVELMIIISITGLVAVLSVPNFNRFMQTWRLNGEIQEFATALRMARSSAVMKNIDVVFSFDDVANTYSYFEDNNGNGKIDAGEVSSPTYEMSPGITITAYTLSSTTMTFGGKGNTRESGTITLRNVNNKTKAVRIYGGTGNITID